MERKRIIIVASIVIFFIIAIIISHIYYNNKIVIRFETGTDEKIMNQYLNKNSTIKKPSNPEKEGFVFIEWQENGENFDFNKEVDSNIILSAKWLKEEYVNVEFETDSDYEIESRQYLKGNVLTDLPEPIKENYEFEGWYLNDIKYDGRTINSDIVLKAKYKKIINEPICKIGDTIIIIGTYADSINASTALYDTAIGWTRQIIDIYENSEYPYMIGNETGVTGFFKAESIKIAN